MRVTAGWLLALSIALLFADAYAAARMTKSCCCAAMSKNACPLRQPSHRTCSQSTSCSMDRSDAGTSAQFLLSQQNREPSTLTGSPVREWRPSVARLFVPSSDALPNALNTPPDIPPPRSA
jgi:hypothetical protein